MMPGSGGASSSKDGQQGLGERGKKEVEAEEEVEAEDEGEEGEEGREAKGARAAECVSQAEKG